MGLGALCWPPRQPFCSLQAGSIPWAGGRITRLPLGVCSVFELCARLRRPAADAPPAPAKARRGRRDVVVELRHPDQR